MAVPKRRTSRSRKGMRRSHHHLTPSDIRYCSNCEHPLLPHRVCSNCGWYKGRSVVEIKTEK